LTIQTLIDELAATLGPAGVLVGDEVSSRGAGIWRTDKIAAPVIFRPATTTQVAAILRACNAVGQPVVTHGGLTGLVEGAVARPSEVVLSTERLNKIEAVNAIDRTMCVQSGVRLQAAQEAAAEQGLLLGLDLGARGSCTIGGNIATNAGGNQVIRYGMARDAVLGLEAVLADGTVLTSMNAMLKNNAGYDLKQLFIGSEGTLGVITRVLLRLRPACRSQDTALVACESFAQVTGLLASLDVSLAGTLTAFELLWRDFYRLVAGDAPPLTAKFPYYVLVEAMGGSPDSDRQRFVAALAEASEQGLIADAAVCKSVAERQQLWAMRDNVEKTLEQKPAIIFDVSLPLSKMEAYVAAVMAGLDEAFGDHSTWVFGHAGDGNLHFVVAPGVALDPAVRERAERAVYEPLQAIGGSISGEHGIGLEKKRWLPLSRSEEEIALMHRLKRALDPNGILNPGRIIDAVSGS